jgi:hypothetical protein
LSIMPEDLSNDARQRLVRLGVEVRLNAPVTAVDATGVTIGGVPAFAQDKFEVGSGGIAVVKRGLSKDTVKDARADQRPSIGAPARIGVNPSNT